MLRFGFLLLVIALVPWLSCAYYNIFWLAESDYDKAVESGNYDFWDPYTQPDLTGEPKRLVDSCIERCGKLLVLYPGSRWADDALLIMGNCFLMRGEHQNALRKYDEILELYASSDYAPVARYMKAYTLIRDGSVEQGTVLLRDIGEDTKHKDIRERASYLLGRIAHEREDCGQAIQSFEAYLTDFPKGAKTDKVRLYIAACLLRVGRADEVISVLDPLGKKQSEEGRQAALKMGEAYREMGQNDTAIEIFDRLTEKASEDSVRARAKMETARTMVARQEAEKAVSVLDEAAEIATGTLQSLEGEIIYTQGLIYEKNLQDFDAAIASYDKIARSASAYGKKARKRAQALKDVKRFTGALSDSVADTREDEAEQRFLLAETYLDDLGLRDEAFLQFKTVADSFTDTGFAPKAILRTAVLLEVEGDSLAEAYYRRVVEVFPGTVYANVARSNLGLPLVDVVIPKPDTAAVWETGQVVGPPLPADTLTAGAPEIPGPPLPDEVGPDSAGVGRRIPPGAFETRTTVPVPDGSRFPSSYPARAESTDTVDRRPGGDSTGSGVPADTTGQGERQVP